MATNRGSSSARAFPSSERLALALQGSLLLRYGDSAVAEAFVASRLGGEHGYAFGTLPRSVDCHRIIERARPETGRRTDTDAHR